eukprot:7382098-Prymnesium_polylepis.1
MPSMQLPMDVVPHPVGTEEPIGNVGSWREIQTWFATFEPRLQVVHGPTGCGKTFAVEAIAFQKQCKITELNGSDKRTAKEVGEFLDTMCGGATLKPRILLLDDADSMEEPVFHRLVKAIKDGALPPTLVILNDYWCQNARPLHQLFKAHPPIEFKRVDAAVLMKHARRLHPKNISNVAKLSENADGDMRQFKLRAWVGDACEGAMRNPDKWELTERLFGQPLFDEPLSTPAAADTFAIESRLMTPMLHENLPRNASDIHGLADATDALSHADEMRKGGAQDEAAVIDAMAPFTGGARKPRPEIKFPTLLGHIKKSGTARKRIASDHQTALRREMESKGCVGRATVDTARRCVDLDRPECLGHGR